METTNQASKGTGNRQIHRCQCGKRISRYATECRNCHKARMDKIHAEARAIVAKGVCPQCGASLRRNNALTGWWQCSKYGNGGTCSFQTFTE